QAVNNAIAITKGKNLFVTVADMAGSVGRRVSQLTRTATGEYELGAWIDELVPFLRQSGMRIREVSGFSTVEQVAKLAQSETGPVVFAIKTTVRTAAGATEEILHSVIAMRSPTGVIRFADYGGRFVGSLPELVGQWGTPTSAIELYQSGASATVINGATLTGEWMMKLAKGGVLVMEGLA